MRMRTGCKLCLTAVLAAVCLMGVPEAQSALRKADAPFQDRAPEFPWAAFQRFWNVRCLPGSEIQEPQYVGGKYVVQYGHAVSLVVRMERDIVRSVTAHFPNNKEIQGGGQRWLKLVDTIIRVGTYRWPEDRIERVRERFITISQSPAEYAWQNSKFRRSFNEDSGWEFTLDFLSYTVSD